MQPKDPLGYSEYKESEGDGMSENVGYDFQKTAETLKRLGKEFVENTVWPEETKARILTALNNQVDELSREAEQNQGALEVYYSNECSMCGKEGAYPRGKKGEMFCSTCWMVWTS